MTNHALQNVTMVYETNLSHLPTPSYRNVTFPCMDRPIDPHVLKLLTTAFVSERTLCRDINSGP
jgi:hypothetical protein